ncbi:MAG: sigma-70 family RNA polymerase sigma factor [Planctomycetes bacterium]|nr:sigma-70 family RNA polymerase sigma factor [Planctomycetota bacterium]MBL7146462.1 sigma-70 family RNA polymerase sigma factor [Phycisphaerae bacterium]
MSDVTRILTAIEQGDAQATEKLLPLIYEELRLLATRKMSQEPLGQTLQATALVHEAYLRLIGTEDQSWDNRGHFFKAAAEAMRRILIENARRKRTHKRGGDMGKVDLKVADLPMDTYLDLDDLIALDEALTKLVTADAAVADLVKLHCFAGLPLVTVADILGVSTRTAERYWAFAKTWLFNEICGEEEKSL